MTVKSSGRSRSGFRHDVNALRAVAIVLVLMFHFAVPGFGGGFIGVDIFFVISGYLMTKIILEGIESGNFRIIKFYLDRARRIIPALAVMIILVGLVAWFILIPNGFLIYAKHAASASLFVSNIILWSEAGYFSPNAHQKWLLHTWSLSVEWQFYILYPLLIMAGFRFGSRRVAIGLILLAGVVSAGVAIYSGIYMPTAGFYLLPSRAWEMIAGGLVFLYPLKRSVSGVRLSGFLYLAGCVLIGLSVWTSAGEASWPGWRAMIPVAGSMFILWADRRDAFPNDNPLIGWIGRVSYSTYLWHWPIVCGIWYFGGEDSPVVVALGLAASFAMSGVSYRVVETRDVFKRPAPGLRHQLGLLASFAGVSLGIALAGTWVWSARGVPQRFGPEVAVADTASRDVVTIDRACFDRTGAHAYPCVFGPEARPIVLDVIGDSHAQSMLEAILEAVPDSGAGAVRYRAFPACPTIASVISADPENRCGDFNRQFLGPLFSEPPSVIPLLIVNNWSSYLEPGVVHFATSDEGEGATVPSSPELYEREFQLTVCRLAERRPVYLILPLPSFPVRVAETLARDLVFDPGAADITEPLAVERRTHAYADGMIRRVAAACGARLLDPTPTLCPNGVCMGSENHVPVFKDRHHLTASGAKRLIPLLRTVYAPPE